MLIEALKSVPPRAAGALILGGAASVVLALLIINSGSSRAGTQALQIQYGRDRLALPAPAGKEKAGGEVLSPAEVRKLVGQRFMVGLRGTAVQSALLEDARKGIIGGVVLFPEGAGEAEVARVSAELQANAQEGGNPPLLIAIDQEGGPVKRFPQGPPMQSLSEALPGQAIAEGQRTGSYLQQMHINTDLAPVVDLGLPESFIAQEGRTISADPQKVGRIGSAFAFGLQQTLTLAVAKHFPGLGSAPVNTDLQGAEVTAPVGPSLPPFRLLIKADVKGVMVSNATYSTQDPAHGAGWSRKIVTGLLREKLGFEGLVFSDDLSTAGVQERISTPAVAIAAARAGVDILMIGDPNAFRPAYRAVIAAAEDGDLNPRRLEDSYRRIKETKGWMK